jgi:dihydrofolate reductase
MKTSGFLGISLDGFIARDSGTYDFLGVEEEGDNGYDAFIATVDALVIGRKTYEVVRAFSEWPYGDRRVVVLSSTQREVHPPPGAKVEVMSGSPTEIVARLEREGVKHAYIDGGDTVQRFLREGQLDEITISRFPVLIGQGRPLFGSLPKDVRLDLVRSQAYPGGWVQSVYRVRTDRTAAAKAR